VPPGGGPLLEKKVEKRVAGGMGWDKRKIARK